MQIVIAIILFLTSAAGTLAGPGKAAPSVRDGEPYYEYVQTDVLVKFKAPTAAAEISALAEQIGSRVVHWSDLLDYYRIEIPVTMTTADAVLFFRASPLVVWANFNYIAHASFTPNDPYYQYQWHYPRINLPLAWDITRGSANVIVAVADQGWQFNHEDWSGVQTVSPRDFIEDDNDPSAPNLNESHGMHVAGTILCATDNSVGVAGIAPLCRLMPIRVLNDSAGSGTIQQIADGIAWAGTHGAHVLNLSLGLSVSGPPQDPGPPLSTAINQTAAAGTVIFAASGNDGQPYVAYPGAYQACIAVGATAYNDAIAPYSNQGQELDITAPGGNTSEDLNNDGYADGVLSTTRDANGNWAYLFWQGTSMATPHACGVGALLMSNGLAGTQVRQALQETAVDLGAGGWDVTFGHGRINALAALQWTGDPPGGEVTLLNEPFETFPLQGWQHVENGGDGIGWQALQGASPDCGGATPHGGANAVWHDDEQGVGAQDDWLVSPQIAIPANATNVIWTFWQRNCYVAGYYEYHAVLISTDGTNWTEVGEFDDVQEDWQQITQSATNLAGSNVYFAWRYQGTYATEWFLDDVLITAVVPGAADDQSAALPDRMTLLEPYPNPFNSVAQIPFELSAPARIKLSIYNLLGQRVATLAESQEFTAGRHQLAWDASAVTSGLYFVKLTSGATIQTRKLLLVK